MTQNEVDNSGDEIYRWLGFRFSSLSLFGIGVLFFAIGYFAIQENEKKNDSIYEKALPVSEANENLPVYITGNLHVSEVGSEFIKQGKYFQIVQISEVFTWMESTSTKGNKNVHLGWTANPEDPKRFTNETNDKKIFYTKKKDLKTITNDSVFIESNGKTYRLDIGNVDFGFGIGLDESTPAKEDLILGDFTHIGKSAYSDNRDLALYENPECESNPKPNCQRVILSILKGFESEVTVVGKISGETVVPFVDKIKLAKGDFNSLKEAYSIHKGISNFLSNFSQLFLFLGIWLGVYCARDQFLSFGSLKNFSQASSTFFISILIAILSKYSGNYFFVVSLSCVAIFLYASKESK